jgi:hypothetical protein
MPILVDFSCSIWKGASATLGVIPFHLELLPQPIETRKSNTFNQKKKKTGKHAK